MSGFIGETSCIARALLRPMKNNKINLTVTPSRNDMCTLKRHTPCLMSCFYAIFFVFIYIF
jgi:hypothetical protein